MEPFASPKRQAGRQAVHEPHSLPDIDMADEGMTDAGLETETEPFDIETTSSGETEEETFEDESGLIEEDDDEEEGTTAAGLIELDVHQVDDNPFQPRREFSEAEITSLAESLKATRCGCSRPAIYSDRPASR